MTFFFLFSDKKVYAHKCVLSTRCEVMAAMFGGHFVESKKNITEVCQFVCIVTCFCNFKLISSINNAIERDRIAQRIVNETKMVSKSTTKI